MDNNIDKQRLVDAIANASGGQLDKKKLSGVADKKNISALIALLPPSERAKLDKALSDPETAKQLLGSPEAQAILKKFL